MNISHYNLFDLRDYSYFVISFFSFKKNIILVISLLHKFFSPIQAIYERFYNISSFYIYYITAFLYICLTKKLKVGVLFHHTIIIIYIYNSSSSILYIWLNNLLFQPEKNNNYRS